ncbi:hypothetical protein H0H92_010389 [Tricholoma furcatifolium]|nr:hypothetical protein H0H92_010389 [Tricholoma furcatifolium]
MVFLSLATTVYGLAKATHAWIEQRAAKDAAVQQIFTVVLQIQNILSPLMLMAMRESPNNLPVVDQSLLQCLKSIEKALRQTERHLFDWNQKSSQKLLAFVSPLSVVQALQDDAQLLNQQVLVLIAAITVLGYVDRHTSHTGRNTEGRDSSENPGVPAPASTQSIASSVDATLNIHFVPTEEFVRRIDIYVGFPTGNSSRQRYEGYLDELGVVSLARLESMVGEERDWLGHLRDAILSASKLPEEQPISTPHLLWVDDNPNHNRQLVLYAQGLGIHIVHFTTTSSAQKWIKSNIETLRRAMASSKIRMISDNRRPKDETPLMRISAGEIMLRCLRKLNLGIPFLIYAGRSTPQTKYVDNYLKAGSTSSYKDCRDFLTAFASGQTRDVEELRFSMVD